MGNFILWVLAGIGVVALIVVGLAVEMHFATKKEMKARGVVFAEKKRKQSSTPN